jgi:hypothetical protein
VRRAVWLLAATFAGCAAPRVHPASMDATPEVRELARLSARVDRLRARLGLPPPTLSATPASPGPPRSAEGSSATPPPSLPPPAAPEQSVTTEIARERYAPSDAADASSTAAKRRSRNAARCRDIAATSDEICHAAERICVLVGQLGADAARCAAAREDCRRAQDLAHGCQ